MTLVYSRIFSGGEEVACIDFFLPSFVKVCEDFEKYARRRGVRVGATG